MGCYPTLGHQFSGDAADRNFSKRRFSAINSQVRLEAPAALATIGALLDNSILIRFGYAVANVVQGCRDTVSIPKLPWLKRKEDYIVHLPNAAASVRLVSASDKLHNARTILSDFRLIGDAIWTRFKGGNDGMPVRRHGKRPSKCKNKSRNKCWLIQAILDDEMFS